MPGEEPRQRYSRLAPFSEAVQFDLTVAALSFFSAMAYEENCVIIEKAPTPGRMQPFDGTDLISYLERTGKLPHGRRYQYRIAELLRRLENVGLLVRVGSGQDIFLGAKYYFLKELTTVERKGLLWLSKALGPQFIRTQYETVTVQLTGTVSSGDAHAGTGLVIAPNWILTCAHVLKDMTLDRQQRVGLVSCTVLESIAHPAVDVGLVSFEPSVSILPDLAFRDPSLSEPLYTLGYPRVPLAREAPLIMQSGEVTTPKVKLLHGSEVFLYSATARPGNSGGPVISANGHLLGIVTEELAEQSRHLAMPFHAGIRSSTIQAAIDEMQPDVRLSFEDYE